jgi:hypothetical protein
MKGVSCDRASLCSVLAEQQTYTNDSSHIFFMASTPIPFPPIPLLYYLLASNQTNLPGLKWHWHGGSCITSCPCFLINASILKPAKEYC